MTVKQKSTEHEKKITERQFRRGKPVQFYAGDDFLAAVEAWRAQQRPIPTMSEALRVLIETHPEIAEAIKDRVAAGLEAETKKKGKR